MAKKRNRQCPRCEWKAKTTAKVCPRCSSVLSEKREPNGQAKRMADNDKGTPELQAKRKAGERDEVADTLHAHKLITDQQLEAFRVYERARRVCYGAPSAKTSALADMIPGMAGELSDKAIETARANYDAGYAALCRCGSRAAMPQVHDLIDNTAPYHIDSLRKGLNALVELYIGGKMRAA